MSVYAVTYQSSFAADKVQFAENNQQSNHEGHGEPNGQLPAKNSRIGTSGAMDFMINTFKPTGGDIMPISKTIIMTGNSFKLVFASPASISLNRDI
ncbi:MAG: hypothetical protein COB24_05685 [Hyphomicrobiales bacterium]|nr:MAG: hypothetical protein COB24_05685 [Hyphomicrobiales bacterium]